MKKTALLFNAALGIYLIAASCNGGQSLIRPDEKTGTLQDIERIIVLAETIEDPDRKEELLKQAYDVLSNREENMKKQAKKGIGATQDLDTLFALYYLVKGDLSLSQLYVDKYSGLSRIKPLGTVVEARLLLKKHGAFRTRGVISDLQAVISKNRNMAMAHLVLGDAYYLRLNIKGAKGAYRNVLRIGGILQVLAAERLETINKIEQTKLDPKKFQDLIFSGTLKRGEAADILYRVYAVHTRIRTAKTQAVRFTDLGRTRYAESIKGAVKTGLFSYIKGDNFEPSKNITRREMALLIEDYIALTRGNSYRQRFRGEKTSAVPTISVSDEAYNAVRLAVHYNIMDLSLGGTPDLDETLSGLDGLIIINRLVSK